MAHENGRPIEAAAIVQMQAELGRLAREHRLRAAGAHAEARKVARGVHHAGEPQPGEQEGKREAQPERVVDGADQQDGQGGAEQPAQARRHDVHAAVHQHHRAALRRLEAVEPVREPRIPLKDRADHAVGPSYFQRPFHAASTWSGYCALPRLPL